MFGFLLQWPTFLTLVMFPILVWMYSRLAIREEHKVESQFGENGGDMPRERLGLSRVCVQFVRISSWFDQLPFVPDDDRWQLHDS